MSPSPISVINVPENSWIYNNNYNYSQLIWAVSVSHNTSREGEGYQQSYHKWIRFRRIGYLSRSPLLLKVQPRSGP